MSEISNEPMADAVPAPDEVALYVYDNPSRKLSLQTQMGLQCDKQTLVEMTAATRLAAQEHLDFGPSYREQRPQTLATVTDQVLKECCDIRKYKDGWPVSRYIRIYLKNYHPRRGTKKRSSKKASKISGRPGPGRHSAGYTAETSPEVQLGFRENTPSQPKSVHFPSSSPRYSSSLPSLTRSSASSSPSLEYEPPQASRCPASVVQETPEPSLRRTRYIAATPAPDFKFDAVLRFLTGLRFPARDVQRLAGLFRDVGIETQEYLEIFAEMDGRDAWLQELRDDGALSEIQMRVLRQGLNRLLGNYMGR
ncbi:hypothetical protein C8Q78DRAFT_368634 [Trametes maxima]|nr:hypothetical protein C8Q78DRAFT_368634 [Trametes maxima]